MKKIFFAAIFFSSFCSSHANGPYCAYLLAQLYTPVRSANNVLPEKQTASDLSIPRYKIPAGNVFCRMEDKLTKATKVWITVGVK